MKTFGTFLAIGLIAAFQAAASPPSKNAPVSNSTIEKKLQVFTPLTPPRTEEKNKIERYGNMSSQPWTQIVGWHPGQSAFPDADMHESQLRLLWIGAEPEP